MNKALVTIINMISIVFITLILILIGCEGSDVKNDIDGTVEEFAGKKKVEQMKDMEKSIGEIQDKQTDRLNRLDNSNE